MIRETCPGFQKRSCASNKPEQDNGLKRNHPAPAAGRRGAAAGCLDEVCQARLINVAGCNAPETFAVTLRSDL